MYELSINSEEAILKIAKKLINFSMHQEKVWKMKFIIENLGKDWDEIKNKLFAFKKSIDETTLNKSSIKQLPSLQHANFGDNVCSP